MIHNGVRYVPYRCDLFAQLKRLLPKSLTSRFLLILVAPVLLSQLVISSLFLEKYTQTILGIISGQMAGEASAVARLLDMHCEESYVNELKKSMNLEVEVLNAPKVQKHGIAKNHKAYRVLRNAIQKKGYEGYYISAEGRHMDIYIPSSNGSDIYKISFSRRILYMKIIPIVLGGGISSCIIFLAIALIFMKNQLRAVKRLAVGLDKFGKGVDTGKFTPEGALEIRAAGMAFCQMKKNVKELMDNRMRILAGISHDLRTPLTKMKLQLSLMPNSQEREWLMNDVDMMVKMTESFTLYAAEQNKELPVEKDIRDLIGEIAVRYRSDEFAIYITGDAAVRCMVRPMSMQRALGNIISNAKKYAKRLYIDANDTGKEVIISFEDDGCGIDIEKADELFLPFKKQNEARTHSIDDGVGLGLSIARDAIDAHGGGIFARNSERYGGACFIVKLPRDGIETHGG